MLSDSYPFSFKNLEYNILNEKLDFPDKYWGHISNEAKDLIKKLLCKSFTNRITAKDALKHPWFNIINTSPKGNTFVTYYENHTEISMFKKAVYKIFIQSM